MKNRTLLKKKLRRQDPPAREKIMDSTRKTPSRISFLNNMIFQTTKGASLAQKFNQFIRLIIFSKEMKIL
jgi:hypothetical protein